MDERDRIRHVARLARLDLEESDLSRLASRFAEILRYVERLRTVDTTGVEPTPWAVDLSDVLREDEPGPTLPREDALRNNPAGDGAHFLVPKILDDGRVTDRRE